MPSTITMGRLCRALHVAHGRADAYRQHRLEYIKAYVGRRYMGTTCTTGTVPLNMLRKAVDSYLSHLVPGRFRVSFETDIRDFRWYADMLALAVDKEINRLNIKRFQREVVMNAMLGWGCSRTGLVQSSLRLEHDSNGQVGLNEIYTEVIEDPLVDPAATRLREAMFFANGYRVGREWLLSHPEIDTDAAAGLAKSEASSFSSAQRLSDGKAGYGDRFEAADYVDLVDVYLPDDNIIVTLPGTTATEGVEVATPLRITEAAIVSDGDDRTGEYDFLSFGSVPGNVYPSPPASVWFDLTEFANIIARKAIDDAMQAKTVVAYQPGAADDAERILDAGHRAAVQVADTNAIREMNWNGPDASAFAALDWLKNEFSESSGGVDSLSGTRARAPTLGQQQILAGAQSVRLEDMADTVNTHAASVVRKIGAHVHADPMRQTIVSKRDPMFGQVELLYTPELRQGDIADYRVRIDPFMEGRLTPQERIANHMMFMQQVVPGAFAAFQASGGMFNPIPGVRQIARDMGIASYDEMFPNDMYEQMLDRAASMSVTPPGKAQPVGMRPQQYRASLGSSSAAANRPTYPRAAAPQGMAGPVPNQGQEV